MFFSSVPNAFQEAGDLKGTHGGHHGTWKPFRASGVASPVAPRHWNGIWANHPAKCLKKGWNVWKMMKKDMESDWKIAGEDEQG